VRIGDAHAQQAFSGKSDDAVSYVGNVPTRGPQETTHRDQMPGLACTN